MYLTRCQINPASRGGQKLLASPHSLHAAVLAGFHDGQDANRGRVLWRLDRDAHRVWLYVSSGVRPDLTHLIEQAGWPTTQAWESRAYEPLLDALEEGQRWRFRLRANPVRSVRSAGSARGRRVGHVTVDQQLEWFAHRAAKLGIAIAGHDGLGVTVSSRGDDRFRRGDGTVTIRWANFDGVLQVLDPVALRGSLQEGVGPAKGYGCGLMTLAPAS